MADCFIHRNSKYGGLVGRMHMAHGISLVQLVSRIKRMPRDLMKRFNHGRFHKLW